MGLLPPNVEGRGTDVQTLSSGHLYFEQVSDMLGTIGHWGVAAVVCLAVSDLTFAEGSWAEQLIDTKKLDFGVVATGSETSALVKVRNTTTSPVHISSVSTACACAQAAPPSTNLLQPGEEATIAVTLNTRQFSKKRDTSVTIFFDSPELASVQIPISAYIRTDVVFDPGIVRFGSVEFGAGAQVTVRIAYAGRPDWKIMDVRIGSEDLSADLKEIGREGGLVSYELTMKLSATARPQRLRDLIHLITDDAANPRVPLMVEGTVVPDISVTPETVQIRALSPGETTTVRVVIRGRKPFLIEDIDCEKLSDCFTVKLGSKPNMLHVVDIEFHAPEKSGKFSEQMVVKISDREEPIRFQVSGLIN